MCDKGQKWIDLANWSSGFRTIKEFLSSNWAFREKSGKFEECIQNIESEKKATRILPSCRKTSSAKSLSVWNISNRSTASPSARKEKLSRHQSKVCRVNQWTKQKNGSRCSGIPSGLPVRSKRCSKPLILRRESRWRIEDGFSKFAERFNRHQPLALQLAESCQRGNKHKTTLWFRDYDLRQPLVWWFENSSSNFSKCSQWAQKQKIRREFFRLSFYADKGN